jgi:hypothetical protein
MSPKKLGKILYFRGNDIFSLFRCTMATHRIIADASGKPLAVEITYRQWLKIQKDLQHLRELRAVKADLQEAFTDVKAHRQGKAPLPTLSEFLGK